MGRRKSVNWLLADQKIIGKPNFNPNAILEYLSSGKNKHDPIVDDIRKHLAFLGWKIEFNVENHNGAARFKYTSPRSGKAYFSLIQICQELKEEKMNDDGGVVIEPENCPEAVKYWCIHGGLDKGQKRDCDMKSKAKSHLAFLRWKFWYAEKGGGKSELRYTSPSGVTYYSLRTACQGCIDQGLIGDEQETANEPSVRRKNSKDRKRKWYFDDCENPSKRSRVTPKLRSSNRPTHNVNCDESLADSQVASYPDETSLISVISDDDEDDDDDVGSGTGSNKIDQENSVNWHLAGLDIIGAARFQPGAVVKYIHSRDNYLVEDIRRHLASLQWKIEYGNSKGTNGKLYNRFRYTSPGGKCYYSLIKLCQDLCNSELLLPSNVNKTGNESSQPTIEGPKCEQPAIPLRAGKSIEKIESMRQEALPRIPSRISRTVLGTLIEQNVVSSGDKLHYRCKYSGRALKTGIATREGIKCDCCDNYFTLTAFEAHAGSTLHRPAANIFLEDGRSLMECQGHVSYDSSSVNRKNQRKRASRVKDDSDFVCSVCHNGGDLILCDGCPSCFHQNCLGLQDVPIGEWFCPSCRCVICQRVDKSLQACEQCELKYHPKCLKNEAENSETSHQDKWFCRSQCKMIHSRLQELLGMPIPVSNNNFTWTLLKSRRHDGGIMRCKLNAALEVLHECFQRCEEGYTGRDLVEDVIFCRKSKLKRLDLKGFYTVILQKDGEVASAATIRIFGAKVAEVPLVATRYKFQKQGMCRIMMSKLEEVLKELGVEKLVLPSISSTLETWTKKFGFSEMTDSEKGMFVNYMFLVFPDIILCQKTLANEPIASELLEIS